MAEAFPPLDYEKYRPLFLDSTGRRLTSGLFEELANSDSGIKPVFKLADWRKTYVAISDPTDYTAALHLLGDWDHWLWLLKQCQAFASAVGEWREEVAVKLASEAVANLREQAKKPTGIGAAKWLAERGFEPKKMGRPKKNKEHDSRINDDYNRLIT